MTGIEIPNIEAGPYFHPLGQIRHIIRKGGPKKIEKISTIVISPKISERLLKLSDGQVIILTDKRDLKRPSGVDGMLFEMADGKMKWISHKLIDQFEERIKEVGLAKIAGEIEESWKGGFNYHTEQRDDSGNITVKGLRPPQIGGLHAIGAHWSLYNLPATLVMPTGTGKTETMLATLVAFKPGPLLVVVPSRILRNQTAKKFMTLGLLRLLGTVGIDIKNPIVGIIEKRPHKEVDLSIFETCNVVISTMSALADEASLTVAESIASRVTTLIVDEAHHIAADGWNSFREHFLKNKVLQFTATPYRRDGKLVDGKLIYEYPLYMAQKEGYFKKISFEPVYEIDEDDGDMAITIAAIEKLQQDLVSGKDHLIMARCANIDRATAILKYYEELAPEFHPVLIHSREPNTAMNLERIKGRHSRIAVCVNMLGEGFDLPNLKIAAIHDTHKSLAVLLQFTGRFTRTNDETIGDATVFANIARADVSSALERLYSEDADWNYLLSEFSSEAAKAHAKLIEFLNNSKRLDEENEDEKIEIAPSLLRPIFNTLVFTAPKFEPKKFFEGLPKSLHVQRVWYNQPTQTIYFVTRAELPLRWTRSKTMRDKEWHLFVLHFDQENKLLFISSSDKSSNHEKMAEAVGSTGLLSGDRIFRCLGRVNRLIFQQVGVKKHGRRNLGYALYTGADVLAALSMSERAGSRKSNLSGMGWEDGRHITIGCSYKGRMWARDPGTIPELITWCEHVGKKLLDDSIDTNDIIANVLIPEEVKALPDKHILGIDWPVEILRRAEERVELHRMSAELSLGMFSLEITKSDVSKSQIEFCVRSANETLWATYILHIGGDRGFSVNLSSDTEVRIRIGKINVSLEEYLSSYPPLIRFVDLSELDGNLLIRPQNPQELSIPIERFEVWDWTGVNIKRESIWKNGTRRNDSVQGKVAQEYINNGYEVVFNDDAPGEAADLICLKEETDCIHMALIHCKFSMAADPGLRIKDVVDVCSQSIRSAKWKGKFKDLCQHIHEREKNLRTAQISTRYLKGGALNINRLARSSRFKEIKPQIIIVQPGITKSNQTPDQVSVIAAAFSYLKETIGIDLDIICSG